MTVSRPPIHAAIGGLIAMAAAMGIGRFVYTPILPYMTDAIGLTESQAGFIAAANFLGYLLGALAGATGLLSANRRVWLLGALAVSALSTGAMALTISITGFLFLRFVSGVCSALVMVFGSALVIDRLTAADRPALAHYHYAGVGSGMAVSAIIVATLGALSISWTGQWMTSAVLAGLGFLAVLYLIPPGIGETAPPAPPCKAVVDRRIVPLAVAYGLFGFGYVITATFISVLVRQSASLAPIEPYIWLTVGLSAVPSVGLWMWVGRRIGNAQCIALACLVEAIGVAATVMFDSASAVILGGVLLGGTFMGITAVGLITARQMAAGDPRRMLALLTAAFGAGQMIGPAFGGYLADVMGNFTAPTLTATGALVIAGGLAMAARKPAY